MKDRETEFPYPGFPYKLVHVDGRDKKEKKTCYFQTEDHMKKHIQRYGLKKKDFKISNRNEEES